MVWRRLPTFFPNFPLRMMPLSEAQAAQIRETGWVREAAFRTEPHVNKIEIKRFLETVYGARVERVSTLNYEGKKKRRIDPKTGVPRWVRLPDWKKAYVVFRNAAVPAEPAAAGGVKEAAVGKQQQQQQQQQGRGRWWLNGGGGTIGGGYPGRLAEGWGVPSSASASSSSASGRSGGRR